MRSLIILCLAPVIGTAEPQTPADTPAAQTSRYQRTVQALQRSTSELQADFGAIALAQLAEAYIAEADLARNQARQQGGNSKLTGWSRAVDQYAEQLILVLEDISEGFPAELAYRRDNTVSVGVAGRLVILSHPRADQQAGFEQGVLREFCSRHDCQGLTATYIPQEPIPLSASQVQPRWTFAESGPVCSHDGISLYFSSTRNLAHARGICRQLLEEAITLAGEIAWQQRHGVSVDWRVVNIRATPRRPEHLVQLNFSGDTILATLPLLHRSVGLLADLQPWLASRYSGGERVAVRLQARAYGWETPVN